MKSLKINFFIALFILWTSCNSQKHQYLIGIWQDAPGMAAGWSDNYQIFDDGTFTFNYNQMLADKTTLSYSGTWKVDADSNITFTKLSQTIIEGGKLVPATGSAASEYELEGGEIKTIKLPKPETEKFKLSNYRKDADFFGIETMMIGDKPFWKMQQDPSNYN